MMFEKKGETRDQSSNLNPSFSLTTGQLNHYFQPKLSFHLMVFEKRMVEYEIRPSPNPSPIAGPNPILLFSPTLTRLVLNTLDTDTAFILEKCNFHLMVEHLRT